VETIYSTPTGYDPTSDSQKEKLPIHPQKNCNNNNNNNNNNTIIDLYKLKTTALNAA
jgi:hypothetical protein